MLCTDATKRQLLLPGGGFTRIYAPDGSPLGETIPEGEEGIVYGEIDIAESIEAKQIHDIVGHYQRFDIFSVHVDQRPQEPIRLLSETPPEPPNSGSDINDGG